MSPKQTCVCLTHSVYTTVSNTRAACGSRGHFVRFAMLFGNFQIINVCAIQFIHRRQYSATE